MNKQILVMKYHPAKKDVEFQRFQNGHNVPIRPDSRLMQYMKQKGKFVLQDHGNSFFDDIANAFYGLKSVDIQVITTKLDYEDLVQMVDLYNAQSEKCKINLTSLIELPDMATTYLEVKKYGEQAASILASHRQKLYEVDLKNDQVNITGQGHTGKRRKKVLPTLHKTPPNGTIGGVFVCGGKSLNPGPPRYAAPIVTRRYLQAWQTKPRPTPRRKRRAALPLPRRSRRNKR